ncbi:fumarylacetoacetate hydrolase family protein [Lutimaribacter sp. EGI FJ00015]|uniref:Fumarylacetoacetate hydrolase family protein n=1 Tax=Lutimaribacter degradans TaxID=2945989 RepID=A0ACC5ZUF4_9RHOB|nr:fumarylacetoacetate hydrolase family protein [Lutimaribacter sp. EGI FJ00013]MCM2561676.1 fumarylacetoacetate hydrolase family protein [Lutimaribacter sp. EGI FJ00013]MCO0612611.1 fumarylacetoacetate hydrolase family protein [Lutimaribacter sp. EGI FJ00015]MCO0635270.1 fumarylacetoacetate hydrolase family protein [Lutimaribacter sp. EGI FJ00014]
MKLCSFTKDGKSSYGLVTEAGIVDLGKRFDAPTLRDFIAAGDMGAAAKLASETVDFAFDDVTHDPVIPDPDKIICVGLNFHAHIEETGREETPNPVLFARFAGSQIGHGRPLIKPLESDKFDYEGEVAVIIGKEGRRISEADALDHVAGYACYNDGSVRDWQKHTHQFLPGKTFAGTGGFGPWMTTADEIPDPGKMRLQTRLNGETVQDTTLDLLVASIPRLIAYCSTILPLLPGDVIVSGTPGGVGARRNPPLFMKDGDVCEVEVSGVGILRNPVVAES